VSIVPQIERQLHGAAERRARRPLARAAGWMGARGGASPTRLRIALIVLASVLATTTIALAATGVILTGSPVRPTVRPNATAGEGIPVEGGVRLLPLRAADPAGGLPWGMRIIHTTRGLVCVQIGRVLDGQLGQLGVDGAFHNDGRFHALPADALPDVLGNGQGWMTGNCASPGDTYAGDSVGLQLSAASSPQQAGSPRQETGVSGDRREISFGLLGVHAVSITYREGTETHTQPVLPGLGAYLIVQRYTSGRPLGSVSETDGRDEPGNYSAPAGPNGALTAIAYSYAGRSCVDRGTLRLATCGLSETPPPRPTPLPIVHEPLRAHLDIHNHVITGAQISFRAPYPVTNANESYDVSAQICRGLAGNGPNADVARGGLVSIPVGDILSEACNRPVRFKVEYVRFVAGLPQPTFVGSVTIHEPPGTHTAPLPRRVLERERWARPTRSLHATVHLTLRPQSRAACSAAFLLYPCYKGKVRFMAPYAVTSGASSYLVEGFAKCKAGGRPETSWSVGGNVRAHETVSTLSLGLFVLTPRCASSEGFKVVYLNPQGPSAHAPQESAIVGAVTLGKAHITR
jgi:hypothetical protein